MKKNKTQELLKEIPSVDSVIQHFKKKYIINFHFSLLKKIISNEIKLLKSEIINEKKSKNLKELLFSRINEKVTNRLNNSLDSVINGTGIVLHTGLGRAPIDKNILNRVFENIYPYSNLEFNIEKNKRGERNEHLSYLLNSILGSDSSIIVNNNAAAVLLALNSLAEKKEVIISRGELVEIGGSFRIPDVINKANCKMVEVGTTNKTHLKDFENAINDQTGLIMIAHTSNYRVVGFTESVEVKDLINLGKKKKIPVFIDIGSGAFINYEKFGLPKEKLVQDYIKMGIDLISFSGDKLLGGIQSGFICGKKNSIKKLHDNPMYRALRCDKVTISLMENILRTYIDKDKINIDNLVFKLLTRDRKKLNVIGQNILNSLTKKTLKKYEISLVDSFVQAGSGSLPVKNIESKALRFKSEEFKASEISFKFRKSKFPTIGYIKNQKFFIDLKAIPENQVQNLIESIKYCLI